MEIKPIIRVENIVATATLDQNLDLSAVARTVSNVEYDPEEFPGLIYRLSKPRLTALIFNSGKMVITGAKSKNQLIDGFKKIIRAFVRHGIIIVGKPRIQIQNIVASASLGMEVDLEKAALLLPNVMYEPEQFPGLIHRMEEPKVVLLIFSSGKMVITGAKDEDEVNTAVYGILGRLRELECVREIPSML